MKITAILEDFNRSSEQNAKIVEMIRQQTGAEYLVAAMMGDFTEEARFMARDKWTRAKEAKATGLDLALEIPVISGLSDRSTKIFSGIALLKRLYSVDQVAILCRGVEGDKLYELGKFLFMAPPAYQAELKKQLGGKPAGGNPELFEAAQIRALSQFFPEMKPSVAEVLADPVNRTAVEIVKAMFQFYWVIKPAYVDISELPEDVVCQETSVNSLAEELHRVIQQFTPEALAERLADTPDGSPELCSCFLAKKEQILGEDTWEGIIGLLTEAGYSVDYVRGFLVKFLLGMERGNLIICGLRSNCPHGRVLALSDAKAEEIQKITQKSWTPLIFGSELEAELVEEPKEKLDECGQMLAHLDERAQELFSICTKEEQ